MKNNQSTNPFSANAINWEEYLPQYDLIYRMPSRCWQDGIAVGNGRLNALWDERRPVFRRHTPAHLRKIANCEFPFVSEMIKENPAGNCGYASDRRLSSRRDTASPSVWLL